MRQVRRSGVPAREKHRFVTSPQMSPLIKRARTNVRVRKLTTFFSGHLMCSPLMIPVGLHTIFSWRMRASDWDAPMASLAEVTAVG